MWDSLLTDYNIVKWGKFARDPLQELAAECRRQGIQIGFYYSVRDWHHPDWTLRYEFLGKPGPNYKGMWGYPVSAWTENRIYDCGCTACVANRPITPNVDPRPTSGVDMNRHLDYMKGQITELLTRYGQVGVMWFDGQDIENAKLGRVAEMIATMRKLQPGIIINDRIGPDGMELGDYGVHEGSIPGTHLPRDWKTCATTNGSWGFDRLNHNWVSSTTMIQWLADSASKGGNLLLNVGPDSTGQVPEAIAENLAQVGAWLRANGTSIYGCSTAGMPQPNWGRITGNGSLLMSKPGKPFARAYLLADTDKKSLPVAISADGMQIAVPDLQPSGAVSVIVLETLL
jgi:alpha-L-fucosidase